MDLAFIRVLPIHVYTIFPSEVLEKMYYLTSQQLARSLTADFGD